MKVLKIFGVKGLIGKLDSLPKKVAGQVQRKALRNSGKRIQQAVKKDVAQEIENEGSLISEIKVRAGKRSRTNISVEVRTEQKGFPDAAFHEFGTSHEVEKPGWRTAYDTIKDRETKLVINDLWDLIEQLAK